MINIRLYLKIRYLFAIILILQVIPLEAQLPEDTTWVKQKQQTSEFRFEVSGSISDENGNSRNHGQVDAVKIINKRTGQRQLIMDIEAPLNDSLDAVVQVQDCNFDGYPDVMIYAHDGGFGPNEGYYFYLYNPSSRQFEENEALSNLTQVEVDPEGKIITSVWRDGAPHHGGEHYTFSHDTLTKIYYWDDYYVDRDFTRHKEGKLVNGKWDELLYYSGNVTVKTANVFPEPNDKQRASGTLFKGDDADIRRDTALWFYVEATDSGGHAVNGWLRKQDLLPQQLLSFSAQTEQYHFAAAAQDSSSIAAVQIIEKGTNKVIQVIPVYENLAFTDSLVETGDYNADGAPDFRIETDEDDNQSGYNYYLFDKKENIFKIDRTSRTQKK